MEFTAEQQQYQLQYQYQQQQTVAYDTSQYDQSATAADYYSYTNQQQQQFQYHPIQDSYAQNYSQYYQESIAPVHPPGVPLEPAAQHSQPTVCYPPHPAAVPQQPQLIPVSGSYSANFSWNTDNPPSQMQPAYRHGKRGGRPFRGGSRGHHGNRGLRQDGAAPPHSRGRGQSGSKQFSSNNVTSAIPTAVPGGAATEMPPSASVPGQAALPTQVPPAPLWPPPRIGWCELCRVDCNRPEILEQHKNGKRHKKNLKRHEEPQKLNEVTASQQNVPVPNLGLEVLQLQKVEQSDETQKQQETLPSAVTNDGTETNQQKDLVNNSEASTTASTDGKKKLKDPSEAQGRGLKRKIRKGQGSKCMRSNEGARRPVEPPKLKGVIPFMCELCNVKCESLVVYNSHLAGKKHTANMKRFHEHQSLYGEAGLQALYPPNLNAPLSSLFPQIQGVTDPQAVLAQLLTYVLNQAQVSGLAAPQLPLPATSVPTHTPSSTLENQYSDKFSQSSELRMEEGAMAEAETLQQSNVVQSKASLSAGNSKAGSQTLESEKNEMTQRQSFTAKFEVPLIAGTDGKVENGASNLEKMTVIPPMDKPILATSEYQGKQLISATSEDGTRTELETVPLNPVDESESGKKFEEPEGEPEEEVKVENDESAEYMLT